MFVIAHTTPMIYQIIKKENPGERAVKCVYYMHVVGQLSMLEQMNNKRIPELKLQQQHSHVFTPTYLGINYCSSVSHISFISFLFHWILI